MIESWSKAVVDIAYLVAAIFFIFGLKFLSRPALARKGNQLAAAGMMIAIVATFLLVYEERHTALSANLTTNLILMVVALVIGAGASSYAARVVQMTSMPQMVAAFNGMGGATAALVGLAEFSFKDGNGKVGTGELVSIVLGVIIGGISFSGSIIAFAKLQELMPGKPIRIKNQQVINFAVAGAAIVLGAVVVWIGGGISAQVLLWVVFAASLVFGLFTVMAIGGADMPVVIAVLNSLTGLAAALAGLALGNQAMVVAGALVGASGSYLTLLMAKAMNRSVMSVLFGSFGPATSGGGDGGNRFAGQTVRQTSVDDLAMQLSYANEVIIVPGYGLAVAQAHHGVRELADVLKAKGVRVRYAIHPVAGRMPGHMNVLLAEANVAYDDLYEMEQINDDFANTDVVVVIGANDVLNPAAKNDPTSPIYGMPILDVEAARSIVVLKRSMKPGYAGIENEIFYNPKTSMLFGDAKETVSQLVAAAKQA